MTNRTPPEEPMDTGPSEADVVHLLGTYADALESTGQQRGPQETARPEGKGAMGPNEASDQDLLDMSVIPAAEKKPARGRMLAGALAVVGAAVVGGFLLTNGDATELDVAAEAVEAEVVEGEAADAAAADSADDQAEQGEELEDTTDSFAEDSAIAVGFGQGPGQVIFADGEFVSIGNGPDGIVVARSADGTNWSTTTVDDFPANANASMLAETDSGWATIVEVFPEFHESDEASSFFEPDIERWLATSTNLADWTLTELPDLELDENESIWVSGIAGVGDRIAIVIQAQTNGPDEFRILLEAGIVDGNDLENFCGNDFTQGAAIVGYTCDFEEDAETETREELFRIEPGDPIYDELAAVYTTDFEQDLAPAVIVSGPLDGPFDISTLPVSGFQSSIVATDQGFVVVVTGGQTGSALASPDGVTWTATGEIDGPASFTSITAAGNRLLGISNDFDSAGGSIEAWVSDDSGATWTSSTINTELFGSFGMPVGGPAGFAVLLDGSVEPFENPFNDLEPLNIPKDGFTMVFDMAGSTASLIGPDGEIIHDSISLEEIFSDGTERVARTEGALDETIVWLDPETGEDLVAVSESDFEAAFEASNGVSIDDAEPDFEEQARATELWFSEDGQTWTLLESIAGNGQESFTSLAAVGDDEIILRSQTFSEVVPPEELLAFEQEGREPTAEEAEALESFFNDQQQESSSWRSVSVG